MTLLGNIKILEVEKEIEEIITTNPYLYKLILSDERSREEQRQEYLSEIEAYEKYEKGHPRDTAVTAARRRRQN